MQAHYEARFERDMGCTPEDWLRWLPGAVDAQALQVDGQRAIVELGAGHLTLQWQVLPPRQIALVRLPRLKVSYVFEGVGDAERQRFMRYFDLYMQRGGG